MALVRHTDDVIVTRLLHSPVKSLRMTDVDALAIDAAGVADDRVFFLLGDDGRSLNAARRLPLCAASASYSDGVLTIRLADGTEVTGPTERGERLEVGFDMGSTVACHVVNGPWREALSGFAREPVRLARVADGRGGWSGFPVSMIGAASIDALGRGPLDARRFRMMIEFSDAAPFAEDHWIGRDVAVGEAVVRVEEACVRCAVTTCDPDTGERDVDALHAMIEAKGVAELGVYCSVVRPGTVRLGDVVSVSATTS